MRFFLLSPGKLNSVIDYFPKSITVSSFVMILAWRAAFFFCMINGNRFFAYVRSIVVQLLIRFTRFSHFKDEVVMLWLINWSD